MHCKSLSSLTILHNIIIDSGSFHLFCFVFNHRLSIVIHEKVEAKGEGVVPCRQPKEIQQNTPLPSSALLSTHVG